MGRLLERINSPKELKKLGLDELEHLADELRDEIISTVSNTGGHLASSLGVVELTIALHYVFDSPTDKIIWDVGHQSYPHKMLTGRRAAMSDGLRQNGGIAGFPKREESEHDVFGAGHASTSISAALGIAEALSASGKPGRAIAVIGDGGLTGGLAFEGLNNAGHRKRNLIVILNDNEMSISRNTGAMSDYLSRKMTGSFITGLQGAIKQFLLSLPRIGGGVFTFFKRLKNALKNFISPGWLFEALGFQYVGPISGHSLSTLIETLKNVKKMEGPILLHVITVKGKGYKPAEENPAIFHGVSPFNVSTGKPNGKKSSVKTYTAAFSDALIELAEKDLRVSAITAAMPQGTGLEKFAEHYPDRFYDVGIAEEHAVTFAAGLASQGMRPVVAIYSTFLQRAYDQIVHDICLQNLPVILALDRGGLVGADGATHNGVFDLSYLRHIPNMAVMAPKDEFELKAMLGAALDHDGPIALRYPRGYGMGSMAEKMQSPVEFGKAQILKEGKDISILAVGPVAYEALAAAEDLEEMGISAQVVNARFVKPLDKEVILKTASETGRVITVEENALQGGFGSSVLELLESEGITGVHVHRIGIPDKFVEHGNENELRKHMGLTADGILKASKKLLDKASTSSPSKLRNKAV